MTQVSSLGLFLCVTNTDTYISNNQSNRL